MPFVNYRVLVLCCCCYPIVFMMELCIVSVVQAPGPSRPMCVCVRSCHQKGLAVVVVRRVVCVWLIVVCTIMCIRLGRLRSCSRPSRPVPAHHPRHYHHLFLLQLLFRRAVWYFISNFIRTICVIISLYFNRVVIPPGLLH